MRGRVASQGEYTNILRHYLRRIQDDNNCDLILADDDVYKNYSLFRTFRKTAVGRARAHQD